MPWKGEKNDEKEAVCTPNMLSLDDWRQMSMFFGGNSMKSFFVLGPSTQLDVHIGTDQDQNSKI